MKTRASIRTNAQYSVRGVPRSVDQALKKKARKENKSLNAVVVELLEQAVGTGSNKHMHNDLDHLAGTWVDDPEFDEAVKEFHRIDAKDWE